MPVLKGQLELLRARRNLLATDVHRCQRDGSFQLDRDRGPRSLDFHVELAIRLGAQAHHRIRHLAVGTCQIHGRLDDKSASLVAIDGRIGPQLGLQERHQARLLPGVCIDHGMAAFGQDARNIFEQAAARYMGKCIDLVGTKRERASALPVDVDAGLVDFWQGQIDLEPGKFHVLVQAPLRQRIAIPALAVGDE